MSDNQSNIILLGTILPNLKGSQKTFAESLYNQYSQRGNLSAKQWPYVEKIIGGLYKESEAPKKALQVDNFSRVIEIFDYAKSKGYKKRIKLRLGDENHKISLSPAPDNGVNAGSVYIKVNDEYRGKINRDGQWIVNGERDESLVQKVSEFSMSPGETARKYGFKTGTCCVCGRTLTDKTSIAHGIGPDCAANWGL